MDNLKELVIEFFKNECNFTFRSIDLEGKKLSRNTGFYQKRHAFIEKEFDELISLLSKTEEERIHYFATQKSPSFQRVSISLVSMDIAINTMKRHTNRDWNLFELETIEGPQKHYIVWD